MTSLILGTAQFGLPYGITNSEGKIQRDHVFGLLDQALENGVTCLDTSPNYGDAESILGEYSSLNRFQLVSKSSNDDQSYVPQVEQSLSRLKVNTLNVFLTHGADALTEKNADLRFARLLELKEMGLVERIGASIYSSDQIDTILANFDVDVVQVPFNVFDQRLLAEGHLKKLKSRGIAIHVRSIFLQGLLLSSDQQMSAFFDPLLAHIEKFEHFCKTHQLSRLEACCAFINSHKDDLEGVLFGVTKPTELQGVVDAFKVNPEGVMWQDLGYQDAEILDPRNWPIVSRT
ncbi:MAG: aldo/keto reductase [Alphaproteobacteria bacterium]|nr:aldo/keto reductase [Alphaproteobacteria bacterium]